MKNDTVHAGPRSLRLWIEDDGLEGIEWHCPPGQCREHQDAVCPHAVLPKESGGAVLCDDVRHCKTAMMEWALRAFYGFAKLYEERA